MIRTSRTLTVRGVKVRSQSQRRYILVLLWKRGVTGNDWGAEIRKRSDNPETLLRIARNYGWSATRALVVVDTSTGEEVPA